MEGGDTNLAEAKKRLLGYRRVDENGCWLVRIGLTKQGYCRVMVNYELDLGHRWAYRIFKGPIPEDLVVRHDCDVPNCVNPDHLRLGTQSDNILDCVARGRHPRNRGGAKLTWEIVREIRSRSTERIKDLAQEYGVTRHSVSAIRNGRAWVEEGSTDSER